MGYPAYSDMQNGLYNPFVWILLVFGEYNTTSLIIELLFYYVIAILGAYKFSGLFVQSSKAKIFIAVAYGFSGFMLGTTQIMIFIAGAAFLPHILFHFIRFLKTDKLVDVLYCVLFLALCITSASPAYTIVLIYLMGIIFVYHWIKIKRKKTLKTLGFSWIRLSLMAVLLIGVLLPYINSVYEFLPYFNRANKLTYSPFLLENPFDYHEYLSFFFPFTTLADSTWFGNTDMTMRSGYIGLLPFIFLIYSLKFWKENTIKLLWIGTLIFLILCAGGSTPFYRLFYELPGFGLFRHPSLFRAHALLFAVVLAGIGFEKWNSTENKKAVRILLLGLISLFICVLIWSGIKLNGADLSSFFKNLNPSDKPIQHFVNTYLFINALVLLPLIILALWKLKKGGNVKKYFVIILILDLFIYSQITARHTIHYSTRNSDYVAYFKNLPKTIDQTNALKPYKELVENYDPKIEGIWRNTATLHRKLTFDGHNQTQFIHFNEVEQNGGLKMALENNLFYDINERVKLTKSGPLRPNTLWQLDTEIAINPNSLTVVKPKISINNFSVEVTNKSSQEDLLILNQNFHHLWKAFINGKEVSIYRANDAFMSIIIPKKSLNKVEFKFDSPRTKTTLIISIISYLILFGGIVYLSWKEQSIRAKE
jgi:hypothetical protein